MRLPKYVTTFTYPDGECASYPFKSKEAAIQFLRINYAALIADEDDIDTMYISPDGKHARVVKDNGDTTNIYVSQVHVSDDYDKDRPIMSLREANELQSLAAAHPDNLEHIIQTATDDFMLNRYEARKIVLAEKGWTNLLSMLPFEGVFPFGGM